jgi:hypothetical protein
VGKDISGLEMNNVEIVDQGKWVHPPSVQSGMEPSSSSPVAILRLPRHDGLILSTSFGGITKSAVGFCHGAYMEIRRRPRPGITPFLLKAAGPSEVFPPPFSYIASIPGRQSDY